MKNTPAWSAWIGLILVLAYGVPLFFPPPPAWPTPPPMDATLLQRLFPGVPGWWIAGRLACLIVGAFLLAGRALATDLEVTDRLSTEPTNHAGAIVGGNDRFAWVALAIAVLHAISGFLAAGFSRPIETIYFVFLAVPSLVLGLNEMKPLLRWLGRNWPPVLLLAVLPCGWWTYTMATALHSPRAASVVDMWLIVQRLADAALKDQPVLSASAIPGLTNAYMMLEGIFLLGAGKLPLTFVYMQVVHISWTALCGLGMGALAWRYLGVASAIVAQAVFLFSPFVLTLPYNPGGVYIMPLCTLALCLLVTWFREQGSPAAFAAFGAVAGFSGRIPQLALVTAVASVFILICLRSHRHLNRIVIAVALISLSAGIIPGFPDLRTLAASTQEFTFGKGQIAGIESTFFGQRTALAIESALGDGHPGALDIPIGAMLAPFAITRTPIRLLGDALFDPFGAGLIAIGMAVCLLDRRRRKVRYVLFGLLVAGSIVGLTSAGDSVSHTRLAPTLIPLAIFAAIGFELVVDLFASQRRMAAFAFVMVASIITAGLVMFHVVNVRILPASWQDISLEALGEPANAEATFFDYGFECLHVARIAELLPAKKQNAFNYCELEFANPTPRQTRLHFWNPALEADARVSCEACEHWPQGALYTLKDETGLYRAFAISPQGANWTPRLPPERWNVRSCRTQSIDDQTPSFCYGGTSGVQAAPWPDPRSMDHLYCAAESDHQS